MFFSELISAKRLSFKATVPFFLANFVCSIQTNKFT